MSHQRFGSKSQNALACNSVLKGMLLRNIIGLHTALSLHTTVLQVSKRLKEVTAGIAESGLLQVMYGGTNINKDVSALNRGPPQILVGNTFSCSSAVLCQYRITSWKGYIASTKVLRKVVIGLCCKRHV